MSSQELQPPPGNSTRSQGTLLGVVLDLSGSMYESISNETGGQLSRIEGLSEAFRHVMEDVQLFLKEHAAHERTPLRLFIHGFGFWSEEHAPWKSAVGDVLAILANLDERVKHYQLLQPEVESMWTEEVAQVLEERKITGDAKEELQVFVERELKEQAIHAEQQRSVAKFQRWCASMCQRLSAFDASLRTRIAQYQGWGRLLFPLAVGLLWLVRGPALALAYLNSRFETWLQQKLTALRDNAHIYAAQQAEKVVAVTKQALDEHHYKIAAVIEANLTIFLDREAFNMLRLYSAKSSALQRKRAFDRKVLRQLDKHVSQQISEIMSPHANFAWNRSVFLLKQAARALKITPNWAVLKEKTIRCAHQVVWEVITPEVQSKTKALAKARFTRAVLLTIVRETKTQQKTLALEELSELTKQQDMAGISVDELPIFGSSPLGRTLNQTFVRLRGEARLSENEGLLPAILLISDGKPTDAHVLDPASLAEKIKQVHIPIVCCYVTNRNIGRPWVLRRQPGWFWPQAAKLMFAMASSVDEWPQFAERLTESRFVVKKQAKLFIQINHTEYLRSFVEAILLPVQRERQLAQSGIMAIRYKEERSKKSSR
jgi:hypothetical protein